MVIMSGIVVGIDGSHHSDRALEWALREAAIRNAPLTVLTVHRVLAGWEGHGVAYPGDASLTDKARQAAQETTDKAIEKLGDARPASVTVTAVSGIPAEALLNASTDADLLVLGSRGAGGFARLLLGSVSSQVTAHAHVPVVIVPQDPGTR
jgi:nucleotide-binding universal stress UspA family protein